MEIIEPVFIIHSELADQQGENTSLKLCEVIDAIIPGEIYGSQLWNGVWSLQSPKHNGKIVNSTVITIKSDSILLKGTDQAGTL